MRKEESAKVKDALSHLGHNLIVVDSTDTFSNGNTTIFGVAAGPLCQVIEPEKKR